MTDQLSVGSQPPLWVGEYVLHPGAGEGAHVERATDKGRSTFPSLAVDGLANGVGDPTLISPLQAAIDAQQWPDVLRLGESTEPQLIEAGHWGTWAQVLEWMRLAARKLKNQKAEARALHQLGVRSLCLADHTAARAYLSSAFRMRQSINDEAGAIATCDILDLLLGPREVTQPLPPTPAAPAARKTSGRSPIWAVLGAVLVVALILLCGLATLQLWWPTPTPTVSLTQAAVLTLTFSSVTPTAVLPALMTPTLINPSPTPTMIIASSPTSTPTPTYTPTPTPTLAPTPTPDLIGPPPPALTLPAANLVVTCAADKAEHSIRFQWATVTDPSNIKKYELSLSEIAPAARVYPSQSFTSTQPVDVNLPCNKTYRWRVRATDGAGNLGGWSEERQFTLADKTAPAAPALAAPAEASEFDCPAGQPVEVLAKWAVAKDPSGIAQYEVETKRGSGTPTVEVKPVPGNQVQATLSAPCGQPYTWRVRALDGVGNVGAWSPPRTFQVKPPPPDLIVNTLQTTGQPAIAADRQVAVPLRFTVLNQGGTDAGTFRVTLVYTVEANGPFALTFTGSSMTGTPLAPNAEIAFAGQAMFPPAEQGQTVAIQVWADSCLGEAGFGANCRVPESNEANNSSSLLLLTLPMVVTTTLRPAADASVDSRMPTRPYGTSDLLAIGTSVGDQDQSFEAQALLRFDLSAIPPGAQVRQATLYVQVDPQWSVMDAPFTVEIAQVQGQWEEHAVNWEIKPACAQSEFTSTLTAGTESVQWEIADWVQGWVDGQTHWGIVLHSRDGRRAFFSRESNHAPRLVIEYMFVPGPGKSQDGQSRPSGQP